MVIPFDGAALFHTFLFRPPFAEVLALTDQAALAAILAEFQFVSATAVR